MMQIPGLVFSFIRGRFAVIIPAMTDLGAEDEREVPETPNLLYVSLDPLKVLSDLQKDVKDLQSDVTSLKITIGSWEAAMRLVGISSVIGIAVVATFFYRTVNRVKYLNNQVVSLNTKLERFPEDIRTKTEAALHTVDAEAPKAVDAEMKDINEREAISTRYFLAGDGMCPAWAPQRAIVYIMYKSKPPTLTTPEGWAMDKARPGYDGSSFWTSAALCERR